MPRSNGWLGAHWQVIIDLVAKLPQSNRVSFGNADILVSEDEDDQTPDPSW